MRFGVDVTALVLVVLAFGPGGVVQAGVEGGCELGMYIRCEAEELRVGDEIPVVFTVTNDGNSTYEYEERDYDRSGRLMEYSLEVRREDGSAVADPRAEYEGGLFGGLSTTAKIRPGQSFEKTITLNRWALIREPGRYAVSGKYLYYVPDKEASERYGTVRLKEVAVLSQAIEIVVKPRGKDEMGEYIEELLRELLGLEGKVGLYMR